MIDILGMFNLPMSLLIDLQGRDSVLAAPMVIDLARWLFMLQLAGRLGSAGVRNHQQVTVKGVLFVRVKTVVPNGVAVSSSCHASLRSA